MAAGASLYGARPKGHLAATSGGTRPSTSSAPPHQQLPQGLLVTFGGRLQTGGARYGAREDARPHAAVGLVGVDGPQQPHRVAFGVGAHGAPPRVPPTVAGCATGSARPIGTHYVGAGFLASIRLVLGHPTGPAGRGASPK